MNNVTSIRRPLGARAIRRAICCTALLAVGLAAMGCGSKTEEERLAEAHQMFQEGNLLGAIIAYEDFEERYPESAYLDEANFRLSECYYTDRNYDKCREVLDKVIAKAGGPTTETGLNAFTLKLQAYRAENRNREALDLAISTSDSLRLANPGIKQFYYMTTGELFQLNEMTEEAIGTYETLLRFVPTNDQERIWHLETLNRIVTMHLTAEREAEALGTFDKYLAEYPDTPMKPVLNKNMGKILRQMGDDARATEMFESSVARASEILEAETQLDVRTMLILDIADTYKLLGRIGESREAYEGLITDYPGSPYRPTAYALLAESFYVGGDLDTALATLNRLATDYPNTRQAMGAQQRAQQMRAAGVPTTDTLGLASPGGAPSLDAEPQDEEPAADAEGQPEPQSDE